MSAPTIAHPGYEIVEGTSVFGSQTIRVYDTIGGHRNRSPIAAAIKSSEGWILFAYHGAATNIDQSVLPQATLTARTDEDARAWLAFIAALYAKAAAA